MSASRRFCLCSPLLWRRGMAALVTKQHCLGGGGAATAAGTLHMSASPHTPHHQSRSISTLQPQQQLHPLPSAAQEHHADTSLQRCSLEEAIACCQQQGPFISPASPWRAAITTATLNIYENLAVEDEFHRRCVPASVDELLLQLQLQQQQQDDLPETDLTPSNISSPATAVAGSATSVVVHGAAMRSRPHATLVTYINTPCVVIGRNQNPWKETNLPAIVASQQRRPQRGSSAHQGEEVAVAAGGSSRSSALESAGNDTSVSAEHQMGVGGGGGGVLLARRLSGGGAVYHDTGNVCFSFMTHRTLYDPARTVEVLRQFLLSRFRHTLQPADITTTPRNDLFLFGHKITGSAMKVTSTGCYHHLTLLTASDRTQLGRYLRPAHSWDRIITASVDSVRSPVTTLQRALSFDEGSLLPASYSHAMPTTCADADDDESNDIAADLDPFQRYMHSLLMKRQQELQEHQQHPLQHQKKRKDTTVAAVVNLSRLEMAALLQEDFCDFFCHDPMVDDILFSPRHMTDTPYVSKEHAEKKALTLEGLLLCQGKALTDRSRGVNNSNNNIMHLLHTPEQFVLPTTAAAYLPTAAPSSLSAAATIATPTPTPGSTRRQREPTNVAEFLAQQRSQSWQLCRSPRFSTFLRIPAISTGGAAATTGWLDMLRDACETSFFANKENRGEKTSPLFFSTEALQENTTSSTPFCLPSIVIQTRVAEEGHQESLCIKDIRCWVEVRPSARSSTSSASTPVPSASPSATGTMEEVPTEVSDAFWPTGVLSSFLSGQPLHLYRTAPQVTSATPFPNGPSSPSSVDTSSMLHAARVAVAVAGCSEDKQKLFATFDSGLQQPTRFLTHCVWPCEDEVPEAEEEGGEKRHNRERTPHAEYTHKLLLHGDPPPLLLAAVRHECERSSSLHGNTTTAMFSEWISSTEEASGVGNALVSLRGNAATANDAAPCHNLSHPLSITVLLRLADYVLAGDLSAAEEYLLDLLLSREMYDPHPSSSSTPPEGGDHRPCHVSARRGSTPPVADICARWLAMLVAEWERRNAW